MRVWLQRTGLAAFAVMAQGLPAEAQTKVFTLKELYTLCKSTDAQHQSACSGFITGVRHTLDIFKGSLKNRVSFNYCIPPAVSNRDFKDVVVAWTERNQGEVERAAVRGVIKSALEKYPCAGTPAKPFEF